MWRMLSWCGEWFLRTNMLIINWFYSLLYSPYFNLNTISSYKVTLSKAELLICIDFEFKNFQVITVLKLKYYFYQSEKVVNGIIFSSVLFNITIVDVKVLVQLNYKWFCNLRWILLRLNPVSLLIIYRLDYGFSTTLPNAFHSMFSMWVRCADLCLFNDHFEFTLRMLILVKKWLPNYKFHINTFRLL